MLPAVAAVISVLAIVFDLITGKGRRRFLLRRDRALAAGLQRGSLVARRAALLLVVKGLCLCLALGSFRGGPVFLALFPAPLTMASHLLGFDLTPAVAVGMGGAAVAAVLLAAPDRRAARGHPDGQRGLSARAP